MWIAVAIGALPVTCLAADTRPAWLPGSCGTLLLDDRPTFDLYADRNNFPGAMQVPAVKFTITGVDTPAPQLYFQNTRNYPYHYDFVVECLGWAIENRARA